MTGVAVIEGGMYTTVQDLGRSGLQGWGVSPGGVMDRFSAVAANRLLGNEPAAAVLEMTFTGAVLEIVKSGWLAYTGAPWTVWLDDREISPWQSFPVAAGSRLRFVPGKSGLRGYLAVAGGWDVPEVMGSRSTDTVSSFGGFGGRSLQAGDDLVSLPPGSDKHDERLIPIEARPPWLRPAGYSGRDQRGTELSADAVDIGSRLYTPQIGSTNLLRVVVGPQHEWFSQVALQEFLTRRYRVGSRANRMGCRLEGEPLQADHTDTMISDAIPLGSVQIPADGTPMILLANRQTMGGYPKIAVVIGADIDRIGQLRPGEEIGFRGVSLSTAHRLLDTYRRSLDGMPVVPRSRPGGGATLDRAGSGGSGHVMRLKLGGHVHRVVVEPVDIEGSRSDRYNQGR